MRTIVPNPFRRGWSIRLGRLRLFSVPWYWDRVRERLTGWAAGRPSAPPRQTHQHYCEGCDGNWPHEGQMCAQQWAWQCPSVSGPEGSRWLLHCHAFGRLFDQRGDRGGLGHIDGVAAVDLRHRRPHPFGHDALGAHRNHLILGHHEGPGSRP